MEGHAKSLLFENRRKQGCPLAWSPFEIRVKGESYQTRDNMKTWEKPGRVRRTFLLYHLKDRHTLGISSCDAANPT
jgi:hypothetical protein